MKTYNIYIAIVALITIITSCNTKQKEQETTQSVQEISVENITFSSDQYQLADIELGKVEQRQMANLIKLNGEVINTPQSKASISAVLGGYVSRINLLEGQKVNKGSVLLELENREFIQLQQEFLSTKSNVNYLNKEYQRQEQLRKDNINSEKTFEKVSNDLATATAKLKAVEQTLSMIGFDTKNITNENISAKAKIRAPISGYVASVKVNNGIYVEPKDVLLEIVNTDEIMLRLNAFEKDIEQIELGQKINFSTSQNNNFNREATVQSIGKTISNNRTISVIGEIETEYKSQLLPQMYVKAELETSAQKQNVVPSGAVVKYNGNTFIITLSNKNLTSYTFKLIPVKVGVSNGNYAAIDLPAYFNSSQTQIVSKSAYVIVASLINSEEE